MSYSLSSLQIIKPYKKLNCKERNSAKSNRSPGRLWMRSVIRQKETTALKSVIASNQPNFWTQKWCKNPERLEAAFNPFFFHYIFSDFGVFLTPMYMAKIGKTNFTVNEALRNFISKDRRIAQGSMSSRILRARCRGRMNRCLSQVSGKFLRSSIFWQRLRKQWHLHQADWVVVPANLCNNYACVILGFSPHI